MSLSCALSKPQCAPEDIHRALDGNICRCTGYRPILDAGYDLCAERSDHSESAKQHEEKNSHHVNPGKFEVHSGTGYRKQSTNIADIEDGGLFGNRERVRSDPRRAGPDVRIEHGVRWVRPETVEDVQNLRTSNIGKLDFVFGGTSFGVYGKFNPPSLPWVRVDLNAVAELQQVRIADGPSEIHGLSFGACVSIATLIDELKRHAHLSPTTFPEIAHHLSNIGSTQLRNVGSWAGNLMLQKLKGFPSDFCVVALAAKFLFRVSPLPGASEVTVTLDNFWDLPNDLFLVGMTVPFAKPDHFFVSYRSALRPWNSHGLLIGAFFGTVKDGKIESSRICYGAVTDRPVRAKKAEAAIQGKDPNDQTVIAAALAAAVAEIRPKPELIYHTLRQPKGKDEFRAKLVPGFLFKFLARASAFLLERAAESGQNIDRARYAELKLIGCPMERPIARGEQHVPATADHRAIHHRSLKIELENDDHGSGAGAGGQDKSAQLPECTAKADSFLHVTGEARYTDDIPVPADCLYGAMVRSTVAHGRIKSIDVSGALSMKDVVAYIDHRDITGANDLGMFNGEEQLFPTEFVQHVGHPIGFIVAKSQQVARRAAKAVNVQYESLEPVLTVDQAIAKKAFHAGEHVLVSGDVEDALKNSAQVITGTAHVHSQLHFYMEKVGALAIPEEGGRFVLDTVSQMPDHTRQRLSEVLGIPPSHLTLRIRRAGGGFGGKATLPQYLQAACLLAARKLNRAVKSVDTIQDDGDFTGGRHDFVSHYKLGVDAQGKFTGLQVQSYSNAGYSRDSSPYVGTDFTEMLDGVYNFPNFHATTTMCRTNLPSKTAYRSFGKVQAVAIIEQIIDDAAAALNMDPDELRRRNMYTSRNCITPFGKHLEFYHLPETLAQLEQSADIKRRRAEIDAFNASHRYVKRGLSVLGVKFGVGHQHSNGTIVLVSVSSDGTVIVHLCGVELGQGLNEKVLQMISQTLGCPADMIRIADVNTDVLPNVTLTGGSATSEINAEAARLACVELLERLRQVREPLLLAHASALAHGPNTEAARTLWKTITQQGHQSRINLSATGIFRAVGRVNTETDGFSGKWNQANMDYFVQSAVCTEAEIDVLTGDAKINRVDILNDCGVSLHPLIDIGQVEGAFVQGLGYFLTEDVLFDSHGKNVSNDTWEYKPPLTVDIPRDFRVSFLDLPFPKGIKRSKAVGEPPYLLSFSVFDAIKRAIRASRTQRNLPARFAFDPPANPDSIVSALQLDINTI